MLVRRLSDDTVVKIRMNFSIKEEKIYASQNANSGFMFVESLPPSEHEFWKMENNQIISDELKNTTRSLELKSIEYRGGISLMLDTKAKELGFDSLHNAGVYQTTVDNPLKASSEKLGAYAGNVWATAMQIEQQIQSGQIAMPQTFEDLLVLLPQWVP